MNEILLLYLIMNGITIITIVLVVSYLLDKRHLMSQGAELRLTDLLKTDIKLTEQHKIAIEVLMTEQISIINLMIKSIDSVNGSVQTTCTTMQELTRITVQSNQDIQIVKGETEKARMNAEQARVEAEKARVEAEQARLDIQVARLEAEKTRIEAEKARVEAEKTRVEAETIREFLVLKTSLIECQKGKDTGAGT